MSRSLNAEFLLFLRIGMVKTFCIPIVWYLVFSGTVFSENIVAFSSNVSEYDNFTSFNSTEFPFNFTIEEEEGENETVEIETTQLNVEDGSQQATIPLPIPTAESQVLNLTSPEGLVTDYVSSLSYEKEIVKDEDRNVFVSSLESLDLSMENVTLYQTLHDDSEMCWSCNDTGKSDVDCRSEAKDIRECNEASHLNRTDGVCYLWHRGKHIHDTYIRCIPHI